VKKFVLACAVSVGAMLVDLHAARAHVGVLPGEVPADSYTKLTFSVPHGCDGSATTRLRVSIPQGVVAVKPQVVAGWTIDTITDTYPTPVMLNGSPVTSGVTEIAWEGGPLPDAYLQEFGVSVHVPAAVGATLMFPIIQECEEGETAWIEESVDGEEEPEHPAPAITLLAAEDTEAAEPEPMAPSVATEHTHDESEPHVDDYGFSFITGAAFVMGAAGMILGLAALIAARGARPQ
jgi:uncharacterized protein YcnI